MVLLKNIQGSSISSIKRFTGTITGHPEQTGDNIVIYVLNHNL